MANSTLVINVDIGETRVALVEEGVLSELFLEREQDRSPVGNIYLGRVTRVLPGMQAAFVDIGLDRAAFLHVEDIVPDEALQSILPGEAVDATPASSGDSPAQDSDDATGGDSGADPSGGPDAELAAVDAAGDGAAEASPDVEPSVEPEPEDDAKPRGRGRGRGRGRAKAKAQTKGETNGNANGNSARISRKTPIREVLKEGQDIVVQVSKGPISTKGARVTSHVALPGRYVVYMPTVDHIGISKRIGNDRERKRLRDTIEAFKPPQGGLIVRTVAAGLTKKQLKADVGYLVKSWDTAMKRRTKVKKAPARLYADLDIILRTARDLFTEGVERIIIDSPAEHERLVEFISVFMPERVNDIELYKGDYPIFDEYGIEDEISRAMSRKVPLPSGGYLIIDQAEALTAIDVNTGRFTGRGKDLEETIFQTNLESVKEIAYQLRFRNIGGLIVLDFIDMERAAHREKTYRALQDALRTDKAKTTVVRVSELGLIEMTRKRTRESLGRTLHEPCFYCDGTGQLQSKTTICHEILRQLSREKDSLPGYKIVINAHPAICDVLQREQKANLDAASNRSQRQIVLTPRREYHLEQFDLTSL